MNRVWSPVVIASERRHSKWATHSSTIGASMVFPFLAVSPNSLNLFVFLPEEVPHALTFSASSAAGMFTVNSLVFLIRSWEYRFGAIEIPIRGGDIERGTAQAMVIAFGFLDSGS